MKKKYTAGFNLIEIMIALAMGAFLLTGVSTMLTQTKALYERNLDESSLQEAGRFSVEHLSKLMQQGHFLGGVQNFEQISFSPNLPPIIGNCTGMADFLNNDNNSVMFGLVPTGSSIFGCITDLRIDNNMPSDVLVVKNAAPRKMIDEDNNGILNEDDHILDDQIYLVTKSSQGELEIGEKIIGTTAANTNEYIWPYHVAIYYLGSDDYGVKSLKRYVLAQKEMKSEVVAENIDGLRILYGIDREGDFSDVRYYPADQIADTDWINVVSAKIYVVALGEYDHTYHDSVSYQVGDHTVPAFNDGHKRKVVQTTVSVRNSVIRKVTQNGGAQGND